MPSYRLSAEALADIRAIRDYGIATFGLAQALKYHLALESRFELLGQFPRIGTPTYDLRPGLYRYHYKSHTVFYTIRNDA
jgi:toxin ParE1/3/4